MLFFTRNENRCKTLFSQFVQPCQRSEFRWDLSYNACAIFSCIITPPMYFVHRFVYQSVLILTRLHLTQFEIGTPFKTHRFISSLYIVQASEAEDHNVLIFILFSASCLQLHIRWKTDMIYICI